MGEPEDGTSDSPTATAPTGTSLTRTPPDPSERGRAARWLHRFTYLGLVGALLGFAAAMTPSLLPRPPLFLGLIAGVSMAIGYGLGTLVSWFLRRVDLPEFPARVKRVAWWVLAIGGPLGFVVMLIAGGLWQNQVRVLVDEPEAPTIAWSAIWLAPVVAVLVLSAARGLRWVTRWVDRTLGRFLPDRLAQTVGVVLVALVAYWLAAGVMFNGFVSVADSVYADGNRDTDPGVTRPIQPERSGSPASLVSWESLGRQGRSFAGGGPSVAELTAMSGRPAQEPVRVYVGLESAPSADARAELAVRELERTGAFERAVLVVAGATGTGWLEPQSTDSLEYLWDGDTAIATIQYSYLPSWISFLVDQDRATEAGVALFDAVYEAWSARPEASRPELIVYGLSLGSFAAQAPFGSAGDLAARTDGALFMGSPDFSEPWGMITAGRDEGSPEWQPVVDDGRTVRFGTDAEDLERPSGPWQAPHVAYLQHASDPVVWWSPDLIARQPDWLAEPRGPDVTPVMRWYPFVTFLQVTVDQFFGTTVPNGHGHNYGGAVTGAWQTVVPAPAVTPDELARIEALIDAYPVG